jgi:hypothetical protein
MIYSLLSFLSLGGLGFDWGSSFGWSSFSWGSFSGLGGFSWSGFDWGSFDWLNWGWFSGFLGSFLLLKIFGEELLVGDVSFFVGFPGINSGSLGENLSSNSLFGDESLDVSGFVESLTVFLSYLSSNNVFSDIVGLSENESFSNVSSSLWSESSWSFGIGESFNFTISLLENSECNDREVGSADASSA